MAAATADESELREPRSAGGEEVGAVSSEDDEDGGFEDELEEFEVDLVVPLKAISCVEPSPADIAAAKTMAEKCKEKFDLPHFQQSDNAVKMLGVKNRRVLTDQAIDDIWQQFVDPSDAHGSRYVRELEDLYLDACGWASEQRRVRSMPGILRALFSTPSLEEAILTGSDDAAQDAPVVREFFESRAYQKLKEAAKSEHNRHPGESLFLIKQSYSQHLSPSPLFYSSSLSLSYTASIPLSLFLLLTISFLSLFVQSAKNNSGLCWRIPCSPIATCGPRRGRADRFCSTS
jgi:hypothetical protein